MKIEYCKHCGKQNPKESKFCQHCGKILIENSNSEARVESRPSDTKHIDQDTKPYPYVVSNWKLAIMSLFTFGVYNIYWFYKQWKSFNEENNLGHGGFTLGIYSFFSAISGYFLFQQVSKNLKEHNNGKGLESGGLAILYFLLSQIWLGFIPLILVQNKINLYWENKLNNRLIRSHFGVWNWIIIVSVILVFLFAAYSEDTNTTDTYDSSVVEEETQTVSTYDQDEIASSVVNIFCPSIIEGESPSGGSGVILSEDGIVLTNSHIIPQDEDELFVDDGGCLVVLPDPATGQPSEIYLANPIVIPGLSDDYDLAYMQIYDAFYDDVDGEYKGTYPRTFPAFDDTTRCSNEDIKLGEAVKIFGYPAISGGYSLTITDGLVSSFPGDGLIVTSAKISHGNSGGLAIDKDGCMLGVPSLVSSDESESLGVIYSMDLVREFEAEVTKFLENLE